MKALILSTLAVITLCFAPSQARADAVFGAEYFTLENGLEIVVIPNHRVPVVTHMVWYRAGAADEPEGKSGIAHFMEHLMFKGSDGLLPGPEDDLAPGEFSEIVRKLGGNDNAFTSQDYTAYFQSIASEHLETVMRMEAGRMRGMNPPPEEVVSELKVILEERSQRTDNNPGRLMAEKVSEILFEDHPYGDPVIGWRDEMEGLTWEDAKAFYDRYYAPNNAILIVSGDVTGEQVVELAKQTYGQIEARDVPPRDYTKTYDVPLQSHIRYEDPRVRQPSVSVIYRVPGYRQSPLDSLALQVLQNIVGEGSSSRLYQSLVVEDKLASAAGMYYRASTWDDSDLTLYATPLPGVSLERVENALRDALTDVIYHGVTEDEVRDSVARLQNEAIFARDSVTGPAMIFGYSLITGSKVDDVEQWPENIATVTAEQVARTAYDYLMPEGRHYKYDVSGYLLPAPSTDQEAP